MAKGYQRNQERQAVVSGFGRALARRSRSQCELCAASGVALSAYEVPPILDEPEIERCIFICEICRTQIEAPARRDLDHLRCLFSAVWSETPAVQVTAVRLLRELQGQVAWATDLLDQVYLDEETGEWADAA